MLPAAARVAHELLPSLERLCSMKRTVSLTDHQAETWLAVLSRFKVRHINRAIIEIGLSEDPFPDLAKLVAKVQSYEDQESPVYAPGRDHGKVSLKRVAEVAKVLKLEV